MKVLEFPHCALHHFNQMLPNLVRIWPILTPNWPICISLIPFEPIWAHLNHVFIPNLDPLQWFFFTFFRFSVWSNLVKMTWNCPLVVGAIIPPIIKTAEWQNWRYNHKVRFDEIGKFFTHTSLSPTVWKVETFSMSGFTWNQFRFEKLPFLQL